MKCVLYLFIVYFFTSSFEHFNGIVNAQHKENTSRGFSRFSTNRPTINKFTTSTPNYSTRTSTVRPTSYKFTSAEPSINRFSPEPPDLKETQRNRDRNRYSNKNGGRLAHTHHGRYDPDDRHSWRHAGGDDGKYRRHPEEGKYYHKDVPYIHLDVRGGYYDEKLGRYVHIDYPYIHEIHGDRYTPDPNAGKYFHVDVPYIHQVTGGNYAGSFDRGSYKGDFDIGRYTGDSDRSGYKGDSDRGVYKGDSDRGVYKGDSERRTYKGDSDRGIYRDDSGNSYKGDFIRGDYKGSSDKSHYKDDPDRGNYKHTLDDGKYPDRKDPVVKEKLDIPKYPYLKDKYQYKPLNDLGHTNIETYNQNQKDPSLKDKYPYAGPKDTGTTNIETHKQNRKDPYLKDKYPYTGPKDLEITNLESDKRGLKYPYLKDKYPYQQPKNSEHTNTEFLKQNQKDPNFNNKYPYQRSNKSEPTNIETKIAHSNPVNTNKDNQSEVQRTNNTKDRNNYPESIPKSPERTDLRNKTFPPPVSSSKTGRPTVSATSIRNQSDKKELSRIHLDSKSDNDNYSITNKYPLLQKPENQHDIDFTRDRSDKQDQNAFNTKDKHSYAPSLSSVVKDKNTNNKSSNTLSQLDQTSSNTRDKYILAALSRSEIIGDQPGNQNENKQNKENKSAYFFPGTNFSSSNKSNKYLPESKKNFADSSLNDRFYLPPIGSEPNIKSKDDFSFLLPPEDLDDESPKPLQNTHSKSFEGSGILSTPSKSSRPPSRELETRSGTRSSEIQRAKTSSQSTSSGYRTPNNKPNIQGPKDFSEPNNNKSGAPNIEPARYPQTTVNLPHTPSTLRNYPPEKLSNLQSSPSKIPETIGNKPNPQSVPLTAVELPNTRISSKIQGIPFRDSVGVRTPSNSSKNLGNVYRQSTSSADSAKPVRDPETKSTFPTFRKSDTSGSVRTIPQVRIPKVKSNIQNTNIDASSRGSKLLDRQSQYRYSGNSSAQKIISGTSRKPSELTGPNGKPFNLENTLSLQKLRTDINSPSTQITPSKKLEGSKIPTDQIKLETTTTKSHISRTTSIVSTSTFSRGLGTSDIQRKASRKPETSGIKQELQNLAPNQKSASNKNTEALINKPKAQITPSSDVNKLKVHNEPRKAFDTLIVEPNDHKITASIFATPSQPTRELTISRKNDKQFETKSDESKCDCPPNQTSASNSVLNESYKKSYKTGSNIGVYPIIYFPLTLANSQNNNNEQSYRTANVKNDVSVYNDYWYRLFCSIYGNFLANIYNEKRT